MQDLHARVVDVVEDVGERERRREQEDNVDGGDRADHPARGQARGVCEHEHVGEVGDDERAAEEVLQLGRVARETGDEPAERAGHPAGEEVRVAGGDEDARAVRGDDDDERTRARDRDERDAPGPRARARAGAIL